MLDILVEEPCSHVSNIAAQTAYGIKATYLSLAWVCTRQHMLIVLIVYVLFSFFFTY